MSLPPSQNRDLIRFLSDRVLGSLGEQMLSVAVGWQVYALTRRPLDLGLVGLVQFAPMALLSLVAGHVADRFERQRIVLLTELVTLICTASFWWLSSTGNLSLGVIYALLFVIGISRAFSGPASQSLLPHLVTAERLPRVIAWNSSIWQMAVIVGPAIGGLVYGWRGNAGSVYAACAVLSALSVVLLAGLRTHAHSGEKGPLTKESFLAGVRYIRENRVILGAISMDLFAVLLGGAVALLPAYASDILHRGPAALGLLRAAPGAGALLMAAVIAARPLRGKVGLKMFVCVGIFGAATVGFGLSRSVLLSLVCLFILGAADFVSVVIRQMMIQILTPQRVRGRVSAVNRIFIGASNELGEFESGVTAAWWGLVPAVVVGGIGTCAVVVLWAWLFPQLLRLDRMETDLSHEAPSLGLNVPSPYSG